jgi:short-subunit dehydrogenase
MTEAAVTTMVKGILAPRGITVNDVQPGPTETDMTVDHLERVKPLVPLRRVGQPHEIAGLVAYLASEESAYMTGASLTMDEDTYFETWRGRHNHALYQQASDMNRHVGVSPVPESLGDTRSQIGLGANQAVRSQ